MTSKDPASRLVYSEEFAAAIADTNTDEGAGTDASGFQFVLLVGSCGLGSLSFQLQESETQGGTYTDIAGAVAVAAAGATVVGSVDLRRSLSQGSTPPGTGKPWVRCQATATGASNGSAVLLFMGNRDTARYAPTALDFAVAI